MTDDKNGCKKENIFDLTKLAPVEIQKEVESIAKKITVVDQEKLLKNYEILPRDLWDTLIIGDHIRYLRKDGMFRRGGYYKGSHITQDGKNEGKTYIKLSPSPMYNIKAWTVPHDDLEKIYKKKTNGVTQITKSSVDNSETIEYLTKSVDQLKIDMLKSSNEQKRIISLIKKLHGISSHSK